MRTLLAAAAMLLPAPFLGCQPDQSGQDSLSSTQEYVPFAGRGESSDPHADDALTGQDQPAPPQQHRNTPTGEKADAVLLTGVRLRDGQHPQPARVEASMRLQSRVPGHLSKETFAQEIPIAKEPESQEPGYLKSAAGSYNLLHGFDRWQQRLNQPNSDSKGETRPCPNPEFSPNSTSEKWPAGSATTSGKRWNASPRRTRSTSAGGTKTATTTRDADPSRTTS